MRMKIETIPGDRSCEVTDHANEDCVSGESCLPRYALPPHPMTTKQGRHIEQESKRCRANDHRYKLPVGHWTEAPGIAELITALRIDMPVQTHTRTHTHTHQNIFIRLVLDTYGLATFAQYRHIYPCLSVAMFGTVLRICSCVPSFALHIVFDICFHALHCALDSLFCAMHCAVLPGCTLGSCLGRTVWGRGGTLGVTYLIFACALLGHVSVTQMHPFCPERRRTLVVVLALISCSQAMCSVDIRSCKLRG